MTIDKEHVRKVFAEYASRYDDTNPKISLKISHTYRVSEICRDIAKSVRLNDAEADLAWLIGMLHDIGRFEQLRRYNTFSDARSVDHARLSCDILFEDGVIRDYITDNENDELIYKAIVSHSAYRVPDDYDERTKMFADILRDADKIDIIRVQIDTPIEEIYDVTTYALKHDVVSEKVMESFDEKHATLRSLKRTAVDHIVGHISLAYELVYPRSRRLMLEQGYLTKLMAFESDNPITVEQFRYIRRQMTDFLSDN